MATLAKNIQLVRNMGIRYVRFRILHELKKKSGLLKKSFPTNPPKKQFISLEDWRKEKRFWGITLEETKKPSFFEVPDIEPLLEGKLQFFSAKKMDLGENYDCVTNPVTGYRYDPQKHWTEIQDYDKKNGDIKYVWEKSRFGWVYDIIRHDYVHKDDHSKWVFDEIKSWLNANPINCGPNYRCSQEISLRILNWTYALNFYKNSDFLTEKFFQEIMHAVYWQLKHVYSNIDFSRIAVRNNHAITETLALYLGGLFYPFFPEAKNWKKHGKKWFEQEIEYQIYPDGTFLQFSMNYHRVVVQLFCWAFKSSDYFGEEFEPVVYERAHKSIKFLFTCQEDKNGWLPNYGSNDGALFFKFNSCDYRDYRPQLNVLHVFLTGKSLYKPGKWEEDVFWFDAKKLKNSNFPTLKYKNGWHSFSNGGYYILREKDGMTFIRCGNHKDRPAQADNLHLDIWYQGENILFDGGSYKYNTDEKILKYFMGTESHNTIMLDDFDQMQKGPRFIWYNWTQSKAVKVEEHKNSYKFEGTISAFKELKPGIEQHRKVTKIKDAPEWIIEDIISGKPKENKILQYWHVLPEVKLNGKDIDGNEVLFRKEEGMRSDYYGTKEPAVQFVAETKKDKIITHLTLE